jgi:hypothetical protein
MAWAVLCAAGRFLGRWLVRLRTSLLSNGADSDRIRRELEAILDDYSNLEKLKFAAGLFINMKHLQDEADERESEYTLAYPIIITGDPAQLLSAPHHGAAWSFSGRLDELHCTSIDYLIVTHPDADHAPPKLPRKRCEITLNGNVVKTKVNECGARLRLP